VPSLQGRYLYADNGSGNVWALDYDTATGTVLDNELIGNHGGITSFGEDASGDVHAVTGAGGVYRFREVTGGAPAQPPPLLSDTGVFADLVTLTPASGFIEYDVNAPFWSDGAQKRRWIAVPDGETVGFSATGAWTFPVGTVIVKHFELALIEGDPNSNRRLETRLLVHRSDGWRGFTYRWNIAGTDADLLAGRDQETITVTLAGGGSRDQLYEYPSRTDCLACHTDAAGFVLGIRTTGRSIIRPPPTTSCAPGITSASLPPTSAAPRATTPIRRRTMPRSRSPSGPGPIWRSTAPSATGRAAAPRPAWICVSIPPIRP
jgi:hypothetical protein